MIEKGTPKTLLSALKKKKFLKKIFLIHRSKGINMNEKRQVDVSPL
jgi:hypothetical protein